jgi:hypothetical protein
MPRLAESSRRNSASAPSAITLAAGSAALASARLATAAQLMPFGSGLTVPRLDGVAIEQQLWDGEQVAARVGSTLLRSGIADVEDWSAAKLNPFQFLKNAIDRWLLAHGKAEIEEQFRLNLTLSSNLESYCAMGRDPAAQASQLFLIVEPESAGYVVLGPTLRILESAHPRLSATFTHLFLGAMNRWIRVYDYRDAQDRVETLREWYESDPECATVELPDIDRCMPKWLKRLPLTKRALSQMLPKISDPATRQLVELAAELDRLSCQAERTILDEEVSASLMDCGTPLPSLLAVFERHDAIEGCFDEEAQGMLELIPEPNFIIRLNGEDEQSVREAFRLLSVLCDTLACASRLMKIMPGNEPLQ